MDLQNAYRSGVAVSTSMWIFGRLVVSYLRWLRINFSIRVTSRYFIIKHEATIYPNQQSHMNLRLSRSLNLLNSTHVHDSWLKDIDISSNSRASSLAEGHLYEVPTQILMAIQLLSRRGTDVEHHLIAEVAEDQAMAAKVRLETPIFWPLDNVRSALCEAFECPSEGNL